METFRIEEKEAFRVLGYALETTNKKKEATKAIPLHWETFKKDQQQLVLSCMNQEPQGLFGICLYHQDPTDARKFTYLIGVSSDCERPDNLCTYTIPKMTWAIFPCASKDVGKTEAQAIMKWLPRSAYRPLNRGYITGKMKASAPDITSYLEDGTCEVWVGVEKK